MNQTLTVDELYNEIYRLGCMADNIMWVLDHFANENDVLVTGIEPEKWRYVQLKDDTKKMYFICRHFAEDMKEIADNVDAMI